MVLALVFGMAIGVALGMLGGGGSLLVVPVLVFVLGQTAQEATTASLVVVTVAALAGGAGQAQLGNICWRHAAVFSLAALPAIIAGTALGDSVSGSILLGTFGELMLGAAVAMGYKARAGESGPKTASRCPSLKAGWAAAMGGGVGLLTGFFGVGGGFVVVPALVLALGFPIRNAIGTSLAIIAGTGALGAVVHLLSGRDLDAGLTLAMATAMVLGAVAGAQEGRRISGPALAGAFSVLMTVVGLYLIVSSVFLGGPPSG